MSALNIFRPGRLPSLSRIPDEMSRTERFCERCGAETEHIIYRVPKKVLFLYFKEHGENLHATCIACARSTVLTGEERERIMEGIRKR